MPRPKLATDNKRPKKLVKPVVKLEMPKLEPKKELLSPVEEDLGLQEFLKADAYESVLKDIRKDLNAPERLLSRIIHAKGMDSFNDILVKTIARPNAILGASLVTLLSLIVTIFLAKNYGYSYNYLIFLSAFVVGYLLELVLEAFVRLLKSSN